MRNSSWIPLENGRFSRTLWNQLLPRGCGLGLNPASGIHSSAIHILPALSRAPQALLQSASLSPMGKAQNKRVSQWACETLRILPMLLRVRERRNAPDSCHGHRAGWERWFLHWAFNCTDLLCSCAHSGGTQDSMGCVPEHVSFLPSLFSPELSKGRTMMHRPPSAKGTQAPPFGEAEWGCHAHGESQPFPWWTNTHPDHQESFPRRAGLQEKVRRCNNNSSDLYKATAKRKLQRTFSAEVREQ